MCCLLCRFSHSLVDDYRLQNHGYDHLILNLEWAKPSKDGEGGGRAGGGGGLSTGFVSGYGKQLAQDTKERVTFTSHGNSGRY
jgi:hypothetical protein